ncbi:MAG: histidinol-phosphate transaminase [Leptospiraceae bacterium]|nr:histidinol-phosphate transaminase [Leptospiraceae bacterium]
MNAADFVHPHIRAMQGYVPGAQLNARDVIKLNSNENPFPPAARVISAIQSAITFDPLEKYPDPFARNLRTALAERYKTRADQVLIGNGSDEILTILFRALLGPQAGLLIPDPTYSLYPVLAELTRTTLRTVAVQPDWQLDLAAMQTELEQSPDFYKLCIIANPNAPTGIAADAEALLEFVKSSPCPVLIDEAYADFNTFSFSQFVGQNELEHLLVCGTFSKSYSLAGLRIGWLTASPAMINELDKIRDSYNVNRLSQTAALAALSDPTEFDAQIKRICAVRDWFAAQLQTAGFEVLPSSTNFLMIRKPDTLDPAAFAKSWFEHLQQKNILVRYFHQAPLDQWVRISIGTRQQMELLWQITLQWMQTGTNG